VRRDSDASTKLWLVCHHCSQGGDSYDALMALRFNVLCNSEPASASCYQLLDAGAKRWGVRDARRLGKKTRLFRVDNIPHWNRTPHLVRPKCVSCEPDSKFRVGIRQSGGPVCGAITTSPLYGCCFLRVEIERKKRGGRDSESL